MPNPSPRGVLRRRSRLAAALWDRLPGERAIQLSVLLRAAACRDLLVRETANIGVVLLCAASCQRQQCNQKYCGQAFHHFLRSIECCQDRAFASRPIARAAQRQVDEDRAHFSQRREFSIDLRNFGFSGRAHFRAASSRVESKCEQLFNLSQRESQLLCPSDEADSFLRFAVVISESRARFLRTSDQPFALVGSNGLDTDAGFRSQLADLHIRILSTVLRYGVKHRLVV